VPLLTLPLYHPLPMRYRVCKSFEFESGHMLSKHGGRCRMPHGHSRRVDIVLSAETLDGNDMVCDFKALKLAVAGLLDAWDHAMAVNSADPALAALRESGLGGRVIEFEGEDPTTETMARRIFEAVAEAVRTGASYADEEGVSYRFPPGVVVERVRLTETPTSWAEYGR